MWLLLLLVVDRRVCLLLLLVVVAVSGWPGAACRPTKVPSPYGPRAACDVAVTLWMGLRRTRTRERGR